MPYCWFCVESPHTGRRPNRAGFFMVWITGEATFLCRRHAEMCVTAGGSGFELAKASGFVSRESLLGEPELTAPEIRQQRRVAAIATTDPVPRFELERAVREALPTVLVEMLRVGLAAGGGPGPPTLEIEEAPLLEQRRSQSASPGKKKRG